MHLPFLDEIVIVLAASVVVAIILRRFSVPPVVGFILTGIVIGPGGLAIIDDRTQIELLAEVGVILLLFTVGLKLSLRDLWQLRRLVIGGGGGQVVITAAAATTMLWAAVQLPLPSAVFWGLVIALSSTVVVHLAPRGPGRARIRRRPLDDLRPAVPRPGRHPDPPRPAASGRSRGLRNRRHLGGGTLAGGTGRDRRGCQVHPPPSGRMGCGTRSRELFTLTIVVAIFVPRR